jgi:hypothetical protein
MFGVVRPHVLQSDIEKGAGAPIALANERQSALQPDESDEPDDDESGDESTLLRLLSAPLMWQNPVVNFLGRQLGAGRKRSTEESDGAELPVGRSVSAVEMGPKFRNIIGSRDDFPLSPVGQQKGLAYPEWDWRKKSYRSNWRQVLEFDPALNAESKPMETGRDVALAQGLAQLRLNYRRQSRLRDGDSLDLRSLVEFAAARQVGELSDDRLYSARLRTARDLGVIVLLDASGSTAEQSAEHGVVWEKQRRVVASLVAELERGGDRVAAYGFRSRGRENVSFLRIKEFTGRFDDGARLRLASLEPSGFTRMGAAIRHAAHLLSHDADTMHRRKQSSEKQTSNNSRIQSPCAKHRESL